MSIPAARYDAVADFYQSGWPDAYTDPTSVALFELLGPLAGERVLDLACGHGRISREPARRGARVVGESIRLWWQAEGQALHSSAG